MLNNFYLKPFFCIFGNFESIEPKSESTFIFWYKIIFETWLSLEPLAPLLDKRNMCAHRLFCTKFYAKQLLFEAFFDIIDNFGNVEPKSESAFPFQCVYLIRSHYFNPNVDKEFDKQTVNVTKRHRRSMGWLGSNSSNWNTVVCNWHIMVTWLV